MRNLVFCILFLLTSNLQAKLTPAAYGALNVIPGLGHVAKGDLLEGLGYFSTSILLMGHKNMKLQIAGQNIWFYGMYDAWRDAGGTPSKDHNIFKNWAASYNPMNIVDPIGASFIGLAALARTDARESSSQTEDEEYLHRIHYTENYKSILTFSMVGLGEEALFRGFMYPSMSSILGNWGGALLSSLIFGFLHTGNRVDNFTRTAFGMLFCWQLNRNEYDLRKNIFAHTWYDQILVGPIYINSNLKNRAPSGIKFTIPF